MVYINDGGTLTLKGRSGNRLTLQSDTGIAWYLRAAESAATYISYADVSNSNAGGYKRIFATDGTNVNGGGNINWIFSPEGDVMTHFERVNLEGVNVNSN